MKSKKIKQFFLFFLLIINIVIFYAVFCNNKNKPLKVVFLDVGQGDSIFIESPVGNQLLIDGGPNKKVLDSIGKVMPFYDRSIDIVLATHPDQDHIGGIPEIFKNYSVEYFLYTGATSSTNIFKELVNKVSQNKIKEEIVLAGTIIDLGGGAVLEVLYPSGISWKDANDSSIVAKLYYGDSSFILTGDAPKEVGDYLANIGKNDLTSDVLKIAHHGSADSLSESFISKVSPEFSIISAGLDNKYGHPHKEVVDFLNDTESVFLSTYELGNIFFISDGIGTTLLNH